MAICVTGGAPTLFIRRAAYEKSGLARAAIEARLGLTDQEFVVAANLVAIGPIYGADGAALSDFISELEATGLNYYEDFFEMSGNWPDWLQFHVAGG